MWEEHVSVSCLESSVRCRFFFFNCALIQHWWAGGDDTRSPHCSLYMVKSGLSWGSTLRRSVLALEHAAGFSLEDLGEEWWGPNLSLQDAHSHPIVSKKIAKQNTWTEFLQPNDVNYKIFNWLTTGVYRTLPYRSFLFKNTYSFRVLLDRFCLQIQSSCTHFNHSKPPQVEFPTCQPWLCLHPVDKHRTITVRCEEPFAALAGNRCLF